MDKIMLVTGGSRGIGAATALLAASKGYAVCISYVSNAAAARQVVAEIEQGGGKAVAVQADVAEEADILRLFETVDAKFGPLTALVNNAGMIQPHMRLDAFDVARLTKLFATNITGSILCAREAVRRMSTRHGGKGGGIVNLSSVAARLGAPGEYVDYAASKGAIDALTLGLGKEVAAEGIRVNAVRPGLIYTDIHESGGEADRVERLKASIPMQRGGDAAEVAAAILWLLSDEASYITGTVLEVTGGR
jgi:NAD(P)-dependent dehydrogenase (short-subunit alcohol dehydrogenase family)